MKVLVSDSSILIEFSKRGLLGKMFQLEFEFAVPDLLFHEELIDLGSHTRLALLGLGLRVEALDAKGVAVAIAYQAERPALESGRFLCPCSGIASRVDPPYRRQDHA